MLHDLYYPGWMAEIDGKPTPILDADVVFRALEVPAGTHHITFRFVPFSLGNLRAALNAVSAAPAEAFERTWIAHRRRLLAGYEDIA